MRRVYLLFQTALVVGVGVFLVRSLAANWGQIRLSGTALRPDAGAFAVAAGIVLATFGLLIGAWRAVLLGWGERLAYPAAARIWCLSNLARYVPGRIWQIAGMAALAQRSGVRPWAAAGSAVVVQLIAIATGALIAGLFAPRGEHPLWVALSGVVAAGIVATLASRRATALVATWASAALGRRIELAPVGKGALLAAAAVTTLAWIAYGLALYFCTQALLGHAAIDLGTAIGVFTGSYLAGLLAVFTPGGLGVRESILYLWLAGPLDPAAALVVSIGSRLVLTATELLAALLTLPLGSPRPHGI